MAQSQASSASDPTAEEGRLVQGSLWNAIWTMSWPLLLTTISSSLIGLTDIFVAGRLGSAQQAAVGLCEQLLFLFLVFIMSIGAGTTAMVSRAAGAGDMKEAAECTAQSISLSFGMGVVLCAIALSCAKYGFILFNPGPDVVPHGIRYLSIYSFYLIPFSIACQVNSSFRAIGDAKTPLVIVSCMTLINIAGDFLTVLYNWPIAGLGLIGIPCSAITASSIGATMGLFFISRSPLKDSLRRLWPVYGSYVRRILRIGIPAAMQRLGWAFSVFVVFFIFLHCPHPTPAIAAWTIGMRVEGLIFMPLMALSLAVASIVGQNLGAKRVDRAIQAGWNVTWIGVAMMVVAGILLFVFAPNLSSLISTDPDTIEYATGYMRFNSVSEPFLALGMILSGALQGAGDTRTPMWITLACHWLVRLPTAWILALALGWGPNGAWAAMSLSVILMGLLTTWRFQSKGWIKTQV